MSIRTTFFLLAFAATAAAAAAADAPGVGVDDWTSNEIAAFFKAEAGVEVAAGTIDAVGLTPTDLFDGLVDADVLAELGVDGALQQKKCLAAIETLDKRITEAPVDFMEWRVANLALFDMWIMPLAGAPRVGSIWARYFMSAETQAITGAPGRVIAEMGFVRFWACTIFAPEANVFAVLDGHDIEDDSFLAGYADTIVRFVLVVKVLLVYGTGAWATNKLGGNAGLWFTFTSSASAEALGLFAAVFGYYIGWYIIPILVPLAWGQALGQLYGWIYIYSVLDKDHDGVITPAEVFAFVVEAGMHAMLTNSDPVATLMSVPQNMGLKIGGGFSAVGLLGWLISMMAGFDMRQAVLDINFGIYPWIMMPVALLTLFLAGRIGIAFLEFVEDMGKFA